MKIPEKIPVVGDPDYRGDCPSERLEQVTFFAEIRRRYPELYGRIALHPRNEGKRTKYAASRDAMEGLSVGAPDIIIPGRVTWCCELKRQDRTKSRLSKTQLEWLTAAQQAGAVVCVALGWEAAMAAFEEHLNEHG